MGEWLWKGGKTIPTAKVEATVVYPEGIVPLRYRLRACDKTTLTLLVT